MSYVLHPTKWPSTPVDQKIQSLIVSFYELADSRAADAGARLAREVFSPSGKLVAAAGTFHGPEEISKSREGAWGKVTARRHQVLQVFTHDSNGRDLMVIGDMRATLANGQVLNVQFASRFVVDDDDNDNGVGNNLPRLSLVQVFADSAPVIAALKDV